MLERSPIADVVTVCIGMSCQCFNLQHIQTCCAIAEQASAIDGEAKQPQPFTM